MSQAVRPFMVMDVVARANARAAALAVGAPRILRLEVGQPGAGAPAVARAAVQAALNDGNPMGYTEALGRRSLRARIAAHYRDWYGLEVSPARIAVTAGASGAFPLAFLAAFEPGARVALAAPFYPPYVNVLRALGMEPVIFPGNPAGNFQPSVAHLERLEPAPAGLIVASPCNPAGTMLAPGSLAAIAAWCDARGVRLISDEIYHGLNYDLPLASAASLSANAIVVNSFSKYFCMTGWRVGWLVLPESLVRPVERLAQNLVISPPHVSQIAAEAAFEAGAELAGHVALYRRSRDALLAALPRHWRAAPPQGAFYLYVDVSAETADSAVLGERLLEQAGIACAPGLDFDPVDGHRYLRFSYCGPEGAMLEAAERLRGWAA